MRKPLACCIVSGGLMGLVAFLCDVRSADLGPTHLPLTQTGPSLFARAWAPPTGDNIIRHLTGAF